MTYEKLQIQHDNLNIVELDLSKVKNLKGLYFNENIAIEKSLTPKAYKRGCRNIHEMAEYLDVTEEFLKDALNAYRLKYGQYIIVDNYTIYFEPYLTVTDFNSYCDRWELKILTISFIKNIL